MKFTIFGTTSKLFLLLALVLMLFIPVPLSAALQDAYKDMKVEAGFDGKAKVGTVVPFRISVENSGPDISAEVQVTVGIDPGSKAVYAAPFDLPKGSSKVITLDVPINTANKRVDVKIVKNSKTIRAIQYEFKKLIAPQTPVIGVLSDDFNGLKDLNGMKLTEIMDPNMAREYIYKTSVAKAAGEKVVLPDRPAELIQLDAASMPADVKMLNGFDIMVINNFDTSSLSQQQQQSLGKWLESGKTLFIGTGPNARKVYSGLDESLKPFTYAQGGAIPVPESLKKFTEKDAPPGSLNVAALNPGSGKILLEGGGYPLAASYKKGAGFITVLAFDPALAPISGWVNVQDFWRKLVDETAKLDTGAQTANMGASLRYPGPYMNLEHLASRVPENQTPPFVFLLVLIGFYILIAGPILYFILKKKDKRDFSWIAVPAVALVFMGIIYVAGFKTRYTTAVLNTVSLINLRPESPNAEVNTFMAAFNNERGNMKIEYARDMNLEINANRYYDRYAYNSYSPNGDNENARIVSKLVFSDPVRHELYDVMMWEPRYIYASKSIPIHGGIMNSTSISENTFKTTVKNITSYAFRDAFIVIGSSFIEVGDIFPGEEKIIDTALDGPGVKKRFDEYLDEKYGQISYRTRQKVTAEQREKNRKRSIFESTFFNMYQGSSGKARITFCALSDFDPGYSMIINEKQPKTYNTSIIYTDMELHLEKGSRVHIPAGIIRPTLIDGKSAYFDERLNALRIHQDGDVDMSFSVLENVIIEKLQVTWSKFLPSYLKYRPQNSKSPQTYAKHTYKFYIYNISTSKWEETGEKFVLEPISSYADKDGLIKVRVKAALDRSSLEGELLGLPELELIGVVK